MIPPWFVLDAYPMHTTDDDHWTTTEPMIDRVDRLDRIGADEQAQFVPTKEKVLSCSTDLNDFRDTSSFE
jgi:hypothetical protein